MKVGLKNKILEAALNKCFQAINASYQSNVIAQRNHSLSVMGKGRANCCMHALAQW
jgi:hypothetical protein